MEKPETMSAKDLADIVRALREQRGWSQDTLSAISKLSLRTVQRAENAEPSNGDTRRALALAFEVPDADFFNKPLNLPSPEQIQADLERTRREYVTLPLTVASSGPELVRVIEGADMNSSSSVVELGGSAAEAFAGLVDYLRDSGWWHRQSSRSGRSAPRAPPASRAYCCPTAPTRHTGSAAAAIRAPPPPGDGRLFTTSLAPSIRAASPCSP